MSASTADTDPYIYATDEPTHGSVVLTHGPSGTAWQRHFSDGLWHSTTGLKRTWKGVLATSPRRPPILAWHAPEDDASVPHNNGHVRNVYGGRTCVCEHGESRHSLMGPNPCVDCQCAAFDAHV